MNRIFLVIAAIIAALSIPSWTPPVLAQGQPRFERENVNGRDAVAREVLVKFRNPLPAPQLAALAAQTDAERLERVGTTGVLRLRSRSQSANALIQTLSRRPDVAYVEPNLIISISSTPNDPSFGELWGLDRIGATPAWELSVGSPTNVVGVIDTGIDYTHLDLAANVWSAPSAFNVTVGGAVVHCAAGTHGFNAITRQCNPLDDHNHGTHVSGTIGAIGNNGVGVAGVNWVAQLIGIKVFDAQGDADMADVIAGIEFAIAVKQVFQASDGANVRVLSASWGGPEFSQALLDEVNAANDADMLFVAAAGNNSFDNDLLPFYPASFNAPNVIAVAATTLDDTRAYFSNYGDSSVHLAAPGDFILSTTRNDSYGYSSGTSMAAPHVSGAAALVLSECDLDTAALKETLLGSVDYLASLTPVTVTGGRLNVNSALHACTAPPEAPVLTAQGGDSRVTLSWSPVPGALRYDIKRSLTPGGPYASVYPDVKATSYVDTAVTNDTTYYYVVSAENTLGESDDSNEAAATPKIPPDLTVSAVTAPAYAAAGSSIAVSAAIKNTGTGIADPSVAHIHLSTNSAFDSSDVFVAEAAVPGLAPGGVATVSLTVTIPDETVVGRYFLIATADAPNQLAEVNESNNRRARSIQIGPDLVVSALSAPSSSSAGETITVTDSTKNSGGAPAAATSTFFYLSANSSFSSDDVLIGSRAVPPLGAGATHSGSVSLTIPGTSSSGAYYLIAVADGGKAVAETSETNNIRAKSLKLGGDLIVSSLTVPSPAAPGDSIVVTDTTKNQGAGSVAASTTRFYLSTNSAFDASDTPLTGSRTVPALAPGASSTGTTTVTLPESLSGATFYLIAYTDADGTIDESSNTNNTLARPVTIGGDLVISSFVVPSSAAPGAEISVTDTTKNTGGAPVDESVTRFFLSSNSTLDTGDTLLSPARPVPDLAAGATSTGSTSLTLPAGLASASYYIIAKADGGGAIDETSESNNTFARSIQIGGDLAVSAFAAPTKGGAGLPLTVSETTVNQGSGAVGASVTKFYLSTNSSFDAADTLLGARAVPALAAGESSSAETTLTIPTNIAADGYFLIARADADAAVGETSESNNNSARSVQIGSDLVSSVPSGSLKIAAGSSIDFTDTVTNQGGGAAPASLTRYYLSSNSTLDGNDLALEGSRAVPALAAGVSSTGSTSVAIPANAPAGLSYLIVKADGDGSVSETSESNNTKARAVYIGPDLTISARSAPSSAVAGTSISVDDTVTNQGADTAAASTTLFYLSTNSALDASDVPLGAGRDVPEISTGASSSGTTVVTIPATTSAGSYYVLFKADGHGVIGESSEGNNVSARSIKITAAP